MVDGLSCDPPAGKGENRVSPLGRETFIVPVEFEDGWPLASPDTGKIVDAYNLDGSVAVGGNAAKLNGAGTEKCSAEIEYAFKDDFSRDSIGAEWLSLRGRNEKSYSLSAHKGWLRLFTDGETLTETGKTNFFGIRQEIFDYVLSVDVDFVPEKDETAGIAFFQSETYQYRVELFNDGGRCIRVIKVENGASSVLGESKVSSSGTIKMKCVCLNQKFAFSFSSADCGQSVVVAENCDSTILSTERAGGFVGNVIGLFAAGKNATGHADFTNFEVCSCNE